MFENLMDTIGFVAQSDPAIGDAMNQELARQRRNLELIASENIVSPAVMAAMGSVLTNKYAEGYPGKRYYGGCACVDIAENIARDRACQLFGADTGQPGGVLRPFTTRRHRPGHEPGRRRPPYPRFPGKHVWRAL